MNKITQQLTPKGRSWMAVKKYWAAASKWEKYRVLAEDPSFQQYLPETDMLNKTSFNDLLSRHPVVFLKPVIGTGGYGVIKVSRESNHYVVQNGSSQKKIFRNKNKLYQVLLQRLKNKNYIIQQGIDLIHIQNRPVDFRILLLRPKSEWQLMGIMGKWAAPNKIVTNHCRGGKAITVHRAFKREGNFSADEIQDIEQRLETLGMQMAVKLQQRFRYLRELGIDVAIDNDKNIWILEANTRPMFNLFRHHDNKKLFHKIYTYVRHIRKK